MVTRMMSVCWWCGDRCPLHRRPAGTHSGRAFTENTVAMPPYPKYPNIHYIGHQKINAPCFGGNIHIGDVCVVVCPRDFSQSLFQRWRPSKVHTKYHDKDPPVFRRGSAAALPPLFFKMRYYSRKGAAKGIELRGGAHIQNWITQGKHRMRSYEILERESLIFLYFFFLVCRR
jgi:hypothetical protein